MRAEGRSLKVVNASNKFFHNRSPAKSGHGEDVATAKKDTTITPISFQRPQSSPWLSKSIFRAQFYWSLMKLIFSAVAFQGNECASAAPPDFIGLIEVSGPPRRDNLPQRWDKIRQPILLR
jgi:hypothetical protein